MAMLALRNFALWIAMAGAVLGSALTIVGSASWVIVAIAFGLLTLVGFRDHNQQRHANLRNYPDIFDQLHKIVSYGRKCRLVYMMHP